MRKFLKYSLVIFTLICAALLACSYYIPSVSPSKINVMGILGIASPYLFFINIVLIAVWLYAKKYLYPIICLFAIIVSWQVVSKCVAFNINPPQKILNTEKQFKVLTYNVRLMNFYNWSDQKDTRDKMLAFFKQKNADLLCLQEFYTTSNDSVGVDNISAIKNICNYKYIAQCNVSVNNRGKWGSVIFSKFPLLKNTNYSLDSNSRNRIQRCDILINADTVSIFNIHLKSNNFSNKESTVINNTPTQTIDDDSLFNTSKRIIYKLNNAYEKRSLEADVVHELISECQYKHLVCGDFNDIPSSYTYFKIRGNMFDSFLEKGRGLGPTFKSMIPSLRIDYILFSEQFHLLMYKKYNVPYSDHYPIESVFEM